MDTSKTSFAGLAAAAMLATAAAAQNPKTGPSLISHDTEAITGHKERR